MIVAPRLSDVTQMPRKPSEDFVRRKKDSQEEKELQVKVKEMEAMALISALMLAIAVTGFFESPEIEHDLLRSFCFLFYCISTLSFTSATMASVLFMILLQNASSVADVQQLMGWLWRMPSQDTLCRRWDTSRC